MKYSIFINQAELADTKLDLIDCAILDWLYHFCNSKNSNIKSKRIDEWTWINFANLMRDMPLLRINTRSTISNRVKKIKAEGYIETMLKTEKLYVRMTEKSDDLYFQPVRLNEQSDKTVSNNERHCSPKRTETVSNNEPNSNTITISDTKTKESSAKAPTPKEIAEKFFNDVYILVNLPKGEKPPDEQKELVDLLHTMHERNNIAKGILWAQIKEFCAYWNELNQTGTRKRWQMQKTFEVGRRLKTWFDRAKFTDFDASFTRATKPKGKTVSI